MCKQILRNNCYLSSPHDNNQLQCTICLHLNIINSLKNRTNMVYKHYYSHVPCDEENIFVNGKVIQWILYYMYPTCLRLYLFALPNVILISGHFISYPSESISLLGLLKHFLKQASFSEVCVWHQMFPCQARCHKSEDKNNF